MDTTIIRRNLHFTDYKIDKYECRRTIGNWTNYQNSSGLWIPTNSIFSEKENALGKNEFYITRTHAPLQAFVGSEAKLGLKDSKGDNRWISITPINVDSKSIHINDGNNVIWKNLWKNSDLKWDVYLNRVEKLITLHSHGHPKTFNFVIDAGPGQYINEINGQIFVSEKEEIWLYTNPAWAVDASNKKIRVDVRLNGNILTIQPNETDLLSAEYPVIVDPTITITGSSAIDDNTMASGFGNNNFGGASFNFFLGSSGNGPYRPIIRVASASLPDKTYTAFRWKMVSIGGGSGTLSAYFIADVNADWVEGTANNAAQAGSSCWNFKNYNTVAWAGSAGCSTSGVDYDADASPPTMSLSSAGSYTFTLRPSWAQAWKSGARLNGGMVIFNNQNAENDTYSSNSGVTPCFFEIDYSVGPPLVYWRIPF